MPAGVAGTLALDAVWFRRYRSGGGDSSFADWEIVREVESWEKAPAPARAGRIVIEGATGTEIPLERAPALANFMHWIYGISWTAAYAAKRHPRERPWWAGPAFGASVWASDYVSLPLLGVYDPIWKYDAKTLWQDLSSHLVFGTVADATLRALAR